MRCGGGATVTPDDGVGADGGEVAEGEACERGVDLEGDGAAAASSVIHAGNVRPRPLPAIVLTRDGDGER